MSPSFVPSRMYARAGARRAAARAPSAAFGAAPFAWKYVGERRDRVVAAVAEQVLGEPALLLRDRRVALELLGVDDREVEPRLRAVVEEDRVQDLAAGLGQAERDVRDAEDRLRRPGTASLMQADPLDRLDRAARRTSRRRWRTGRRAGRRGCPRPGMPYFSVSSVVASAARPRACAARVTAMPCSGSSSMLPTTSAAPYARASGTTVSKRSSPSSRLIELMIALPWQHVSARSITAASVESIMSGRLDLADQRAARNARMSAISSRSGSARQTSMTCAPPLTCARAISLASSNVARRRSAA